MRKIIIIILSATIIFTSCKTTKNNKQVYKMENSNDSLSYAFGVSIAGTLKNQKVENLNPKAIAQAFEDFNNDTLKMTTNEANQTIQASFDKKEAEKNKDIVNEGKKFLAENAKKDGVVTTKSGLQYKIIKKGTGNIPTSSDKVKVHYKGTLIDGTKFDSSYDRGQPATFGVTQVIKGWTEALQLMKEGAKWEIYIPYNLGYGSRGAGDQIKPFSTLIFTVELLSIEK